MDEQHIAAAQEHRSLLPLDHPDRRTAADEVHARPTDPLEPPVRASFVAVMVRPDERTREIPHLAALCERFGVDPPHGDARQFRATVGGIGLKWERRTEFSAYTFVAGGVGARPFDDAASTLLPEGWLAGIPGVTVVAAHAELSRDESTELPRPRVDDAFGHAEVAGSLVGDRAGVALTDFRIHDDGQVRFLVQDRGFTPRQAGRTLQRLFEIEAYRVMALLALPLVRSLAPRTGEIEVALGALAAAIADQSGRDEALLAELTQLATEVEHLRNASAMRLSASAAYHDLVQTRIAELRERRVPGIQTIGEFMARRLTPAMATCSSLSRGGGRAAGGGGAPPPPAPDLLSTRVEIVRERQNQALLESMDRRARLQLRLQRTVEWLSVAAVTYYGAALVGYVAKALKSAGVPLDADAAIGLSIPVIGALVAWALHRARLKGEPPRAPAG